MGLCRFQVKGLSRSSSAGKSSFTASGDQYFPTDPEVYPYITAQPSNKNISRSLCSSDSNAPNSIPRFAERLTRLNKVKINARTRTERIRFLDGQQWEKYPATTSGHKLKFSHLTYMETMKTVVRTVSAVDCSSV